MRGGVSIPDLAMLLLCLAASAALLVLLGDLPVFGDAWGYGYRSARWMADNGMQPVPAGPGRGEQAMGHPSAFFWTWALLMRLLGDTVLVSHILPAAMTFLALWGIWRLASELGGRAAGLWAVLGLATSPLFVSQSVVQLQDVGFAAFAALSLWKYARGRHAAAALLATAAAACREQAVFLAVAYLLVELSGSGLRRPGRLALHCLPFTVILITGFSNLAVNGYFFFGNYLGEPSSLGAGWLSGRIRLFAGHLLASDGRWIPVTASLALVLASQSRRRLSLTAVMVLLTPALLFPPGRLSFLAVLAAAFLLALLREGRLPDDVVLAAILFVSAMLLFHILIVLAAPDPQLNLYRYVLGAYPAVIAVSLAAIRRRGGIRLLHPIAAAFTLTGALACLAVDPVQHEATPQVFRTAMNHREGMALAASIADTVIVPDVDFAVNPALGYVEAPLPARALLDSSGLSAHATYAVVLPPPLSHQPDLRGIPCFGLPGASSRIDPPLIVGSHPFQTAVVPIGPPD